MLIVLLLLLRWYLHQLLDMKERDVTSPLKHFWRQQKFYSKNQERKKYQVKTTAAKKWGTVQLTCLSRAHKMSDCIGNLLEKDKLKTIFMSTRKIQQKGLARPRFGSIH